MKKFFISMLTVILAFVILDGIWLGLLAKETYLQAMQGLMREDVLVAPWVIFYLMYSAVIVWLVVLPAANKSACRACFDGALLGAAAYGAYNMTNYSLLEGWPLAISLQDWLWGICVTGLCSVAGWWGLKAFNNICTRAN
ncbi:DUF2177 family protein [Aliiglaciecola sp. LCG003]|uniref:DUF2177 family protein n=1 Tax=Aliiglaciecola sp. LCG003 TaxID=3053655 RepID=UPI002572E0A2|nr:DUF2177 family protein [Aliiglaciecola sp. LCG003]WJG09090.1 DUF2177 family protein [Aliiglaciecola sp. LCG003]